MMMNVYKALACVRLVQAQRQGLWLAGTVNDVSSDSTITRIYTHFTQSVSIDQDGVSSSVEKVQVQMGVGSYTN